MQINLDDYEPVGEALYQVHFENDTWTKWITLDEVKKLNSRHFKAFIIRQHHRKKLKND